MPCLPIFYFFFGVDSHATTYYLRADGTAANYAGDDVSLTLDLEGETVPYGSAPDIGAYEWHTQKTILLRSSGPSPSPRMGSRLRNIID